MAKGVSVAEGASVALGAGVALATGGAGEVGSLAGPLVIRRFTPAAV